MHVAQGFLVSDFPARASTASINRGRYSGFLVNIVPRRIPSSNSTRMRESDRLVPREGHGTAFKAVSHTQHNGRDTSVLSLYDTVRYTAQINLIVRHERMCSSQCSHCMKCVSSARGCSVVLYISSRLHFYKAHMYSHNVPLSLN